MIELRGVQLPGPGAAGDALLLDGVDLDLAVGQVACVTGTSGSGKSGLLALVYGAAVAGRGHVRVFGHDVRRLRRSSIALLRRKIGIVPQDLQLLDERTAVANVAVALEVRGHRPRAARAIALELLIAVGLGDRARTRVSRLSRGQAQRVAVARAMAGEPSMLVMDDPTSHQDHAGRMLVADILDRSGGLVATCDPALLALAENRGWVRYRLAGGVLSAVDGLTFDHPRPAVPAGEAVPNGDDLEVEIEITEASEVDLDESVVVPFPRRSAGGSP